MAEKNIVKLDLSVLPRNTDGSFDWLNSVGSKVRFSYNGLVGDIVIVNNNNRKDVTIEYAGRRKTLRKSVFLEGHLVKFVLNKEVLNANFSKNIYSIGQIIKTKKGEKFQIIGIKISTPKNQDNVKRSLMYLMQCMKCGYRFWRESYYVERNNCKNCSNQATWVGVNDIATTDPWMIPYFSQKEDVYKYKSMSNHIINAICPTCNNPMGPTAICNIKRGFVKCHNCKDGISFPEKFFASFLNQTGITYYPQASTDKIGFNTHGKTYDFYIPEKSCIVETHGAQHYRKNYFNNVGGRTLEEEQKNDKYKEQLAKNNGIQHYIVIDCSKSTRNYIKDSICKSNLSEILGIDYSDINWNECELHAVTSLKKQVWDYYNNQKNLRIDEIAEMVHINYGTAIKFIKEGSACGICKYDSKLEMNCKNPIEMFDQNNNVILKAVTIKEMIKLYTNYTGRKISDKTIRKYIQNQTTDSHNYGFRKVYDIERRREILYGNT